MLLQRSVQWESHTQAVWWSLFAAEITCKVLTEEEEEEEEEVNKQFLQVVCVCVESFLLSLSRTDTHPSHCAEALTGVLDVLETVAITPGLLLSLLLLPLSFSPWVCTVLHTLREYQRERLGECLEDVMEKLPESLIAEGRMAERRRRLPPTTERERERESSEQGSEGSEEDEDFVPSSSRGWACTRCTFINPRRNKECMMCEAPYPQRLTQNKNTKKTRVKVKSLGCVTADDLLAARPLLMSFLLQLHGWIVWLPKDWASLSLFSSSSSLSSVLQIICEEFGVPVNAAASLLQCSSKKRKRETETKKDWKRMKKVA